MNVRPQDTAKGICLIITFLLLPIVSTPSFSSSPIEPPYVKILGVDVNISYVKNHTGEIENISVDMDLWKSSFSLRFIDKVTFTHIYIHDENIQLSNTYGSLIKYLGLKDNESFKHNYEINSPPFWYNISQATAQFLINITTPNITNVLDYVQNREFNEDYNEFFPIDPLLSYRASVWTTGPIVIDDTWYYVARSFKYHTSNTFEEINMFFFLFGLIFIGVFTFSGFKYKKLKEKCYLFLFILSVIIAAILIFLSFYYSPPCFLT